MLVALALSASAAGVLAWHLIANRSHNQIDTSGFDLTATPDSRRRPIVVNTTPDPNQSSSLVMLKSDPGVRVAGSGSTPAPSAAAKTSPKEKASLSLRNSMIKNERFIEAFGRRMEARYPSIGNYGRDWAAAPDLRALRDQYWRDRDPIKFAYGLAQSKSFGRLIKKYAADPGVRAFVMEGVKQAPADLLGAAGQVFQNDRVVKDLVKGVTSSLGLPPSLTAFLGDDNAKAPDQNQVLSEIMQSPEVQKAMQNQR
jgi:hypothetical protein